MQETSRHAIFGHPATPLDYAGPQDEPLYEEPAGGVQRRPTCRSFFFTFVFFFAALTGEKSVWDRTLRSTRRDTSSCGCCGASTLSASRLCLLDRSRLHTHSPQPLPAPAPLVAPETSSESRQQSPMLHSSAWCLCCGTPTTRCALTLALAVVGGLIERLF
jgi:hypothetical protein